MKTELFSKIGLFCLLLTVGYSCEKEEPDQATLSGFLAFSATGQTLPTAIDAMTHVVKFEVDHDVDVTKLVARFEIPEGYSVDIKGITQVSGVSIVDFSQPVTYELKNAKNQSIEWKASAVKLSPKILIDGSHDGGVWWFPQSLKTGFDQYAAHQGEAFADILRKKGFVVDELGRGNELTDEMFFGYYIVIRAGGLEEYTAKELEVYTRLIDRGMNMAFFTDHKKYDPEDELGDLLNLKFAGTADGSITNFLPHVITDGLDSVPYMAGSVLINADQNPDIQILGWLSENDFADLNFNGIKDGNEVVAPPVMGILNYPKSHIFFIGDMNGLEVRSQPFIDNLIKWMGDCF